MRLFFDGARSTLLQAARDLSGTHCLICLSERVFFFFANQGGVTAQALWPLGQVSPLLQGVDCMSDL